MLPLPSPPPISTLFIAWKMKVQSAFQLDKMLKSFIMKIRISWKIFHGNSRWPNSVSFTREKDYKLKEQCVNAAMWRLANYVTPRPLRHLIKPKTAKDIC
jgi:hypothetical protein